MQGKRDKQQSHTKAQRDKLLDELAFAPNFVGRGAPSKARLEEEIAFEEKVEGTADLG